MPFSHFNRVLDKKKLAELIDITYRTCGSKETVLLADALRTWGYEQSTRAGISFSIKDLTVPPSKAVLLDEATAEVTSIEDGAHFCIAAPGRGGRHGASGTSRWRPVG